ncbi:MAG: RadC family protein [Thermaurantimonas sp.]|uniref:RadC family protein n=1 Tax=Thermaurantimonas sp. TaxID=2681568 RepID=UPI00391B100F
MSNRSIKDLAEDDRPREKLETKGREALSDAELLAILLGSGTREMNAVELARQVLDKCDKNLLRLARMSLEELKSIKGIGKAKAITILAALELGRRTRDTRNENETIIDRIDKAYDYLNRYLADLNVERFYALYLSNRLAVLRCELIGSGGVTATTVDPIVVFKKALECSATRVIVAHNHPSGNMRPSEADRALTKRLEEGGKLLGIQLIDHYIFGHNECYGILRDEFYRP